MPRAFASPVSGCRFELGDVLYSTAEAYDGWSGAPPASLRAIYVLEPARTGRVTGVDAEHGRFAAAWESEVVLELLSFGGNAVPAPQKVVTTQGRLFTCLWRGDLALLGEDTDSPEPPLLARDLYRALEQAVPAARKKVSRRRGRDEALLFLLAVDTASDASLAKWKGVARRLVARSQGPPLELTPAAAGIPEADRYHPALQVRGLFMPGTDEATLAAELRPLLYQASSASPATNAEAEAAASAEDGEGAEAPAGTDRFSLSRHGLVVAAKAG